MKNVSNEVGNLKKKIKIFIDELKEYDQRKESHWTYFLKNSTELSNCSISSILVPLPLSAVKLVYLPCAALSYLFYNMKHFPCCSVGTGMGLCMYITLH
jgi:hypothetical protein